MVPVAQTSWVRTYLESVPTRYWFALAMLFVGLVLAFAVSRLVRRLLVRAGVPDFIEGTAFDRTARDVGTSTLRIVTKLVTYFLFLLVVLAALSVAEINYADQFWNEFAGFLPQLFVAALILIVGVVIGDKAELFVADRLRGVKLPETGVLPLLAKYSVFYVAALIALSQLGVATLALVVLLGAYALALILLSLVAFKDLLASGAAGMYLLLEQPYSIGDEVEVAGRRGIVQEVDLFVTHVESDDEEHIVPNNQVFTGGVVRIRT